MVFLRLILIEMLENESSDFYLDFYRNATTGVAMLPFSFGHFPIKYGHQRNLTGDVLYHEIYNYWTELPNENSWPCWEMNDHDAEQGGD